MICLLTEMMRLPNPGAAKNDDAGHQQPVSASTILMSTTRALLPDDQHTTVLSHRGRTVRQVMERAMRRRQLTTDQCLVVLYDTK